MGSLTRRVMPQTVELLRRHGTAFSDYVVSGPLCCPSRAVLLTGQYGHNNGVLWNTPNPYGSLRGKHNTLPVWLRRAGYRTAHVGRYLNLYATAVTDPNEVPPGWDEWHTILEPFQYYGYVLRENGHAKKYGSGDRDYLTRVLNRKAVHMIHRYVPRARPLFMEVDQFAPHASPSLQNPRCEGSALPAPRDRALFEHARLPKPPSFNEADVSDKPGFVRAQPSFDTASVERLRRQYGCRLASLRSVDRGVRAIVRALRSEGELGGSAIVFTSDNGWLEGEHRVSGKVDPYEEAIHVPFVLRPPWGMRRAGDAPSKLSSTVANIDVAPTILRLAHARPCGRSGRCRTLDGRSMLKAARSHGRRWPRGRGILLELETSTGVMAFTPCDYEGIRTARQSYVQYHSATEREPGECIRSEEVEHYDLRADPFELGNLYPATPGSAAYATELSLAQRLALLRDCSGVRGRDPEPPSGHYCE